MMPFKKIFNIMETYFLVIYSKEINIHYEITSKQ